MGGKKTKRSRAQSIYFVGPARLQPWSRLEAQDTGPYEPLVRPLIWQSAKRVLAETMVNAKEPYAIYKIVAVKKKNPKKTAASFDFHFEAVKNGEIAKFGGFTYMPQGRSWSDKISPGHIPPATQSKRGETMLAWASKEFYSTSPAELALAIGIKKKNEYLNKYRSRQRRLAKMKKKTS